MTKTSAISSDTETAAEAGSGAITICYRPDADMTDDEDRQLRRLLFGCFPHEPAFLTRRFLKACPAHRWLAFDGAHEIVAHVAVHEKSIGTRSGELKIGGVAEVCVASKHRGKGLAKQLLDAVHGWLHERGFQFAMLFGQSKVYESSGYALIANEVCAENSMARHWNPFCGKPMIHRLSETPWPKGAIDLRGPTF
jgi:GNAT superfamily N-acetyltransferase